MQRKIYLFIILIFCVFQSYSQISPEIYSWILNTTGATGYNNIPSNIQQVQYSASNVYISATCIPGYDVGPWVGNPNVPANQNFVFKITRNPVQNTGAAIVTGLGHIGVFSNGVSIYNPKDGNSYNSENIWHQNAIVVEGPSFDACLGHPAGNGEYHHHLNPTCLYDDTETSLHSPIIGFAFDGFPVYGAFGYANTDGTGGIKRMQSSYHKRVITTRTTLADGSTVSFAGPAVSTTYPIGYYLEDFEFIANSGDLDEHNGRFCITPDYPSGKYCYFVTLDSNLTAEYPYILGLTYYGTIQPGNTGPGSGHNTVSETVTTYTGTLGVSNFDAETVLSFFPNPTQSDLNIKIDKGAPNNLDLEIVNNFGQLICQKNKLQPGGTYSVDLSKFAKGVYFAKVRSSDNVTIKKIILD